MLEAQQKSVPAIARRLVRLRLAKGLSQAELCRLTEISPQTYNNWEKSVGRPDLENGIKLTEKFGVTLDWIYLADESGLPKDLALKMSEIPDSAIDAELNKPPRARRVAGDNTERNYAGDRPFGDARTSSTSPKPAAIEPNPTLPTSNGAPSAPRKKAGGGKR